MRRAMAAILVIAMSGCAGEDADAPPAVRLGDSICVECGMILSDERFATATMVEGARGAEARLFDDFNCQVIYESTHPEETIVTRWSHDYLSGAWLETDSATFLISPALRTPMASHVAAFGDEADATEAKGELGGEVMGFEATWRRLAPGGG